MNKHKPKRADPALRTLTTEWWSEKMDKQDPRLYYWGIVTREGMLMATLGWVFKASQGQWRVLAEDAWLDTVRQFHPEIRHSWGALIGTHYPRLKDAKAALMGWWRKHGDSGGRVKWMPPSNNPHLEASWGDSGPMGRVLAVQCALENGSEVQALTYIGRVDLDGADGYWYASLHGDDGVNTVGCGIYDTFQAAQRAVEHAWKRSPDWIPMRLIDHFPCQEANS